MDKEQFKLLLKEMFLSGEIEIKSKYNKTMDKSFLWVYIDDKPVYSEDPLEVFLESRE